MKTNAAERCFAHRPEDRVDAVLLIAAPRFRPGRAAAAERGVAAFCRMRIESIRGLAQAGRIDAEFACELLERIAVSQPARTIDAGLFGGERITLEIMPVEDQEAGQVRIRVRRG